MLSNVNVLASVDDGDATPASRETPTVASELRTLRVLRRVLMVLFVVVWRYV